MIRRTLTRDRHKQGLGALYLWHPDGMKSFTTADHTARAQSLFDEHGPAVYRFATVLLRHHQDAEDVLQETFLKLLRHLQTGGGTANLRGWLFTVAANAARDRLRRRTRWIPWSPDYESAVAPSPFVEEDERLRSVRQALDRLPSRDRVLLALRAQGLSYREIAAAAGIRTTSVGRLLARAVDRWGREAGHARNSQRGGDLYEVSERRQNSGGRR
jgi:RNA polymerase sigma-70 factor, ECF subfamily